jgi:hypothetical protein
LRAVEHGHALVERDGVPTAVLLEEIPPPDAGERNEGDSAFGEPDRRAVLTLDGGDEIHRIFAARLAAHDDKLLAVAQGRLVRRQRHHNLREILSVGGEIDEVDRLFVGGGFGIIPAGEDLLDRRAPHGAVVGRNVPGGGRRRACERSQDQQ